MRKDREEHVKNVIAPALQAEKIVILDRYYFSTAAYQGAQGADVDMILADNERFAPQPDLLIVLDVRPETGIARIKKRAISLTNSKVWHRLNRRERSFSKFKGLISGR